MIKYKLFHFPLFINEGQKVSNELFLYPLLSVFYNCYEQLHQSAENYLPRLECYKDLSTIDSDTVCAMHFIHPNTTTNKVSRRCLGMTVYRV